MGHEYTDEGYVIKLYDLSDTSLIVYLFLRSSGVVKVTAKGAKSAKSPFAGTLELFNAVQVLFKPSRGESDLHSLREVSVISRPEGLRASYDRLLMGSYFSALIEAWVETNQDVEPIYDLFARALDYANTGAGEWKGVTYFEAELSRLLGYSTRAEEVRKLYQLNERLRKLRDKLQKVIEES